MATQIIMDHSGDSRYRFSIEDSDALAHAERRFRELTGKGFIASVRTGSGQSQRITSFDPTAEETLFFPRLVGG